MWISKKKLHAERVAEFQLGLKLGIGIGRNQIRCQLLAAAERKRKNAVAEAATVEKPQAPKT